MQNIAATTAVSKTQFIKTLYLFLVSFVALMMLVISSVDIISLFLKTYILTRADRYAYAPVANCDVPKQLPSIPTTTNNAGVPATSTPEECRKQAEEQKRIDEENRLSQRQSDLVRDISLLVVAVPLFIGHWRLARKKE